jgi:two-component system, sensor histidine kinase and response regulator
LADTPNATSGIGGDRTEQVDQLLDLIGKPERNRSHRLTQAFVVVAVLLIGMMGVLSWRISRRSAEDAAWVAHTYNVSAALELTLRNLDDVETGARGFALTGLDRFLEPYRSGVQASSSDMERLRLLISDNPGQQQRLGILEEQTRNRLEAAADLVKARRDLARVPDASSLDQGKELMDKVRASIAGMEVQEKLLLEERTQRVRNTRRLTSLAVGSGSILGITFLLVAGAVIDRESRATAKSQAQVRSLNANLERRVQERTEQLELEAASHRETEVRLRDSEQMFRLLLDGIRDYAVYMLDGEGRVVSWNEGAVRIEGYQSDEIIGKDFSCFYTATERARKAPQGALQEAAKTGRFEGEGWRVRKNGSLYWANAVITPLYRPDGSLSGYSKVVRDISARMQADEELKKQASLLDLAHDAILVRDLENRVIYWNRGAQHLYGWSAGEAAGRVTHELLQTVFPCPLAEIEKLIAYKGEWEGELHHHTRSGTEVIVASRWSVQRDGQGTPTAVLEINRDITEGRLTETALGESEGRLAGVIASAMDSIITVDDKQCILLFNRAAEKMFRCVASEALGQPITRFIPQRFHAAHAGHIRKFGELGVTNRAMGSKDALWGLRADGQEFQIEASISQVVTGGKKLFTVILRDVSERVQAQQTLLEAQARMSGIVASAMDAIITVDSQQRILVFNAAAMKIFRCSEEEALGQSIEQFIPQRFHAAYAAHILEFGQSGSTNRAMGQLDALWAVRADGEEFQIEASISQVEISGQKMFTVILRDVTERKRAEYARERLAAVVDSSDDAIMSTTLDGKIAAWNRGAERVFGYSAAEVVGKPLLLLMPPERLKELADILARTWSGESFEHFETVRLRKDGTSINVSVTISPIRDGNGVVIGASAIARDITDRKRAEETLRDNERLLSESQRIAHIGSWSFKPADPDGRIAWSEELFKIYGVSPDTFVPTVESLLNLLVSEDRPVMREWIVACMNGDKPGDLEFRALLPHGKIHVFRGRGELQKPIGDGSVRLVGTVQDVTERREAERELRAQADLLDLSHDVILVRELDGRIRFWNRGAEETYGYPREQVIGAISHMLLQTKFSRPLIEIEEEFLQRGRWEGELTHTTQAGKRIVVESRWVLQRDRNGQPSHVMEANNDITERKEAEEASMRARVEAEEANRAKSNFLANMSHEIRTPMNAIIGMTYLALRAQPAPEQRKYLSKISGAADSLLVIINDILDFSKMEAAKMELENVPFSLKEVLSNLHNIVIHAASQKEIAVVLSTAADVPPYLMGDPLRLGQILINLVNNAIKFTEVGQVAVEVSAEEVRENVTRLRFSVSDTGIGMSAEQVSKLFQSFNQADASYTRRFGGTGLGLAISKQLCDLMGGTLTVKSEAGKGTTFTLTAEFPLSSEIVEGPVGEESSVTRKKSILIVDDNQNDRQTLSGVLNANGFRVKDVSSGEEALCELSLSSDAGDPFDLVLLDWRMPGINGIETARLIKARLDWPHIPTILMVTAFDRKEVMESEIDPGLSGFLVKPVRGSFLVNTIAEIFRREVDMADRKAVGMGTGGTNGPVSLAGRRVLLVEDNELNRDLAGELLADLGISVTMAFNGREGVDRVLSEPFDLVLMDIQMPVMDGLAASRLIRSDQRFLNLPIIAMTAHAMKGDKKQSLDAGMNDHLTKPINPETLTKALLKWMPVKPEQSIATVPKTEAVQGDSYLPEKLAPFDIQAVLRRTNGKPRLVRKLMLSFCNQYAHAGSDLRELIGAGKTEEAQRFAHTLKGIARTLEAAELGNAAFAVETALRLGDAPYAEPLIEHMEKMLAPAIIAAASLENG